MIKKKLLFICFFDSFEENIIAKLSHNFQIDRLIFSDCNASLIDLNKYDALCFGPGPGHVLEYSKICEEFVMKASKLMIPLIGICLGHQLLLSLLRQGQIIQSPHKVHGQSVEVSCGGNQYLVSRYNSWSVLLGLEYKEFSSYDQFAELALFRDHSLLTMQFHPESVGTSCPEFFFDMIHQFVMHNIRDERS